ncbi:DUF1488 family protein [Paraburkholderia ferrariae]|uniref:DUF1488 domain-containing protein n=1 Tax=Paraburkholderia ferrariae TaxID=386056 RepID=UPI0009FD07EE|nr:DUF1488 domain-containing protein [Paraburkholderia ferrariae]
MHVEFIDDEPIYDGANLLVRFGARVDGKPAECAITAEALEDHFGAHASQEDALLNAFRAHRRRIESLCVQALERSGATAVTLHSGFVRMIGLQEQHQ